MPQVDWSYMDDKLMPRFWRSSPARRELRARLPDIADRILIFHRGVGTARMRGLLANEKLDLLCEYTVMPLLNLALRLLPRSLAGPLPADAAARAKSSAGGASTTAPAELVDDDGEAEVERARALARCDSALQGELVGGTYVASHHKYAKVVERLTLARQCPTVLTLLKAGPAILELQEPTFKDIVVVYRRAVKAPKGAKGKDPSQLPPEERLKRRNIYVKVFGETPMADAELIFPVKKVGVKAFQFVNLFVTVVTALFTGALMLWKVRWRLVAVFFRGGEGGTGGWGRQVLGPERCARSFNRLNALHKTHAHAYKHTQPHPTTPQNTSNHTQHVHHHHQHHHHHRLRPARTSTSTSSGRPPRSSSRAASRSTRRRRPRSPKCSTT